MTIIEIDLADHAPMLDRRAELRDHDNDDEVIYDGTAFACAIKGACKAWGGFTDDEKEILDEIAETCEVPADHAGLFVATMTAYRAIWGTKVQQMIDDGSGPLIAHDALVYDNWVNLTRVVRLAIEEMDDQHIMCQLGAEQFEDVQNRLLSSPSFTRLTTREE